MPRLTYRILFTFFLIIWIIPINLLLFTKSVPIAGKFLNYQYRVSRLFTHRSANWSNYYVEYAGDGFKEWRALPLDHFSDMYIYGYTTRLQRVLGDSLRDPIRGSRIRKKLGLYLKSEIEKQHPEFAPIREIRLIRVPYPAGSKQTAKPRGTWEVEEFENTPVKWRKIVSHLVFTPQNPQQL